MSEEFLEQWKAINADTTIDLPHKMDKKLDLFLSTMLNLEKRTCELESNKKWVIGTAWTAVIGFIGLLVKMLWGK